MRAYIAFTQKECMESLRTYKLFIMGIVFLLLGMMSPLAARFAPDILAAMASTLELRLPEPTAFDSWVQFFKNVGQMGLLTLVIIYGSLMAGELDRGTLVNMLTKGLRRSTVILSKFTAATFIWTFSYLLCLGVTFAYTVYFWGETVLHNTLLAFSCLWIFGELLISLSLLGGVLFGKTMGSLLFTGGTVVVMSLINIFPNAQKYNPVTLSGDSTSLLKALSPAPDIMPAVITGTVMTAAAVVGAVVAFNRKPL